MENTDKWAAELSDEFLFCRDSSIHHSWEPWTARFDREHHAYVRVLHCARCDATKEQFLDTGGFILKGKHPTYPEGYLRPRGSGRMTKEDNAALRVEAVLRTIDSSRSKKAQGESDA